MAESKSVVIAALFANAMIAALKFGGFLLTGSAAMLSETYHSISDTGNQVFLLIGIRYSGQEPTNRHPFGYGKAQFFYSFLVSVLLFGVAGWESAKEGYQTIVHHNGHLEAGAATVFGMSISGVYINYAILISAILFEGYAFRKAYNGMKAEIEAHGWSGFREGFRKTSNITTLTALTEDSVALAGLGFALIGLYLTRVTGNPLYDGLAALAIGLLLMGFAVALAWENKRLLLGESLPVDEEQELRSVMENGEGVVELTDFRTVFFGPEYVLVTADVQFEDELGSAEIESYISNLEARLKERHSGVSNVYIEPV